MAVNPQNKVDKNDKKKVGWLLALGIFFIPIVFTWLTLQKGRSVLSRVLSFGWLLVMVMSVVNVPNKLEAPLDIKATQEFEAVVQKNESDILGEVEVETPKAMSAVEQALVAKDLVAKVEVLLNKGLDLEKFRKDRTNTLNVSKCVAISKELRPQADVLRESLKGLSAFEYMYLMDAVSQLSLCTSCSDKLGLNACNDGKKSLAEYLKK